MSDMDNIFKDLESYKERQEERLIDESANSGTMEYIPTNRFIRTIRENVQYPNTEGHYGKWDGYDWQLRKFLKDCAEHMEMLEREIARLLEQKNY